MVSISWCLRKKGGLELTEPNSNMADSYIGMAEESLAIQKGVERSKIWTATTTYYIFYYALYALMLRIGVRCEIHACSLEFMKRHLAVFYGEKDIKMIEKAFNARIDLQYYANRPVDDQAIEETRIYCTAFFIKTKDALAKITEEQIERIREALKAQKS